jgi:hypothetical protein
MGRMIINEKNWNQERFSQVGAKTVNSSALPSLYSLSVKRTKCGRGLSPKQACPRVTVEFFGCFLHQKSQKIQLGDFLKTELG